MNKRETADEVEAEAIRWVWRLDREGRTPEMQAELDVWMAVDPRRKGALLQAEAVWEMLDRHDLQAESKVFGELLKERSHVPRRAFLVGGGAALAASATGAVWLSTQRYLAGVSYETMQGEIRRVPLEDGSTATINTLSEIEVNMAPATRSVRVAKGEVWFQVAKDSRRPFIVDIGRIRVKAIGTAFSVRLREKGVEILVSEGVVETWIEGGDGHTVRVAAGSKASVLDSTSIQTVNVGPSEIDSQLAWRAGKVELLGETLKDAVAEFNRYNTHSLVIVDPTLASERFYGIFRTDDPVGFAFAVHRSLGVPIKSVSSRILIGAAIQESAE